MLGSGTQADPYIIETVQDLQDMNLDLIACYELGNDIDAAETATWNDKGDGIFAGFEPIGNGTTIENRFSGSFNGNGYTISNLYINRPSSSYVGLIGYLYDDVSFNPITIENITMKNVNITGSNDVGGLIGYFRVSQGVNDHMTYLQNCTVDGGSITGTGDTGGLVGHAKNTYSAYDSYRIINNTTQNLSITSGQLEAAGGLIGRAKKRFWIKRCRSINNEIEGGKAGGCIGEIYSYASFGYLAECAVENNNISYLLDSFNYIGGLIGYNSSGTSSTGNTVDINNCYVLNCQLNSPKQCGGLVSFYDNPDTITSNCYAVFTTSGSGTPGGCVGDYRRGSVQNCYWDTEVSGVDSDTAPSGTTGLTTSQMKDPASYPDWDFTDIWANDGLTNEGYNYLQAFPAPVSSPFKYWDGSEWIPISAIKYWNGSEWIPVNTIKHWNGENWVQG